MKNAIDRLDARGASALSDEELLAVLVAEGLNDEEALSVAQTIMAECNSRLANIAECGFSCLRMMA